MNIIQGGKQLEPEPESEPEPETLLYVAYEVGVDILDLQISGIIEASTTSMEAIKAATKVDSEIVGLGDKIVTLELGRRRT